MNFSVTQYRKSTQFLRERFQDLAVQKELDDVRSIPAYWLEFFLLVAAAPEITSQELCSTLRIKQSAAARLTKKLCAHSDGFGLVAVSYDGKTRVHLRLTSAGEAFYEDFIQYAKEGWFRHDRGEEHGESAPAGARKVPSSLAV